MYIVCTITCTCMCKLYIPLEYTFRKRTYHKVLNRADTLKNSFKQAFKLKFYVLFFSTDDPKAGVGTDVHFQDFTFAPEEGENFK